MHRRDFCKLVTAAALVSPLTHMAGRVAALEATGATRSPCWGGHGPCGGYTSAAIERANAHLPFHFEIAQEFDRPVISVRNQIPGHSFEGGVVLKVGRLYRLFTCEFRRGNYMSPSTLPYWVSRDGTRWKFKSVVLGTIPSTKGGKGFIPWEPTPIFDHNGNRWYLFFVAYDEKDCGQIRMMAAAVKGYDGGINGPWRDLGVIMRPGVESQSWPKGRERLLMC